MLPAEWQLAGQFGRSLQEALGFPARRKRGHREAAADRFCGAALNATAGRQRRDNMGRPEIIEI
jgi:hypothetical protein